MTTDKNQLIIRYLKQKLESGKKTIYLPFDSRPIGAVSDNKPAAIEPLAIENFARTETLEQLYETIKDCQMCQLGATRHKFVFGVGNPKAEIMFIGEAPGHEEDMRGEPFVGRAGQLLTRALAAMGLRREDVYIANILKCRPPENRDPLPEEAETCEVYLLHQIALIKPKIICSLGRIAAQRLLRTNMTLGQMRERWFNFQGTPFIVTYHPAALLRSPDYKRPFWEDMQKLLSRLKELKSK